MTDLEICKKIAEIYLRKESYALQARGERLFYCHNQQSIEWKEFNPLTDKALCFDFAVELMMQILHVDLPTSGERVFYVKVGENITGYCTAPERAVCMAKIGVFRDV